MMAWHRLFLGALLMAPPGAAFAQAPAAGLTATQLEQAATDVLKEVHNRGADLYNRGDPAGAYRMYEGALSTVRPFVAHRPAILKAIEDGLNETAKIDGAKVQAFRLHEVLEQVRADLKAEIVLAAALKPVTPESPAKPSDAPKVAARAATVAGTLSHNGRPIASADVTLVTLDEKLPRVVTVTTNLSGQFEFADALTDGSYAVMVTGKDVPAKYTTMTTSPLRITVTAARPARLDVTLE